ncbi:MAG: aminoacyl-tRNA deacylase [Chromatiales bacterium]|nr:aminoacyl-tRNA deacylase [Chromatiales bacterium]
MSRERLPSTQALRLLKANKIAFEAHPYRYVDGGGTAWFAEQVGVDEHLVIKTLIMEDDKTEPMIVLMHGDAEVSTRALARHTGAKSVAPCRPAVADRHSGYQVGGTSPFGTRRAMPVYAQSSIAGLPRIYINAGSRGLIIAMDTADMVRLLSPEWVDMLR